MFALRVELADQRLVAWLVIIVFRSDGKRTLGTVRKIDGSQRLWCSRKSGRLQALGIMLNICTQPIALLDLGQRFRSRVTVQD